MSTKPHRAPRPAAVQSMRLKLFVSMRATVAGMTSVAARRVTPTSGIVARMTVASGRDRLFQVLRDPEGNELCLLG